MDVRNKAGKSPADLSPTPEMTALLDGYNSSSAEKEAEDLSPSQTFSLSVRGAGERLAFSCVFSKLVAISAMHFVKEELQRKGARRFSSRVVASRAEGGGGGRSPASLSRLYSDFKTFNGLKKFSSPLADAASVVACLSRR